MHVACLSHLENKTPGACECKEPTPHPNGCIAPCRHVAPRVSQPPLRCGQGDGPADCKKGLTGCGFCVRGGCAGADVYKIRYRSGNGVRQAALGVLVRSKAFPRRGLPARWQRALCGSGERVTAPAPSPEVCARPSAAGLGSSSSVLAQLL